MVDTPLAAPSAAPTEPQQLSAKPDRTPKGATSEHQVIIGKTKIDYKAVADWIVLRKKEKPVAEIFFVHYATKTSKDKNRPLTFIFNGGPGAASAYLHVGSIGPRRVAFGKEGELLPPPVKLTDNEQTWLSFSDLVFIDPVGTGFSRTIEDEAPAKAGEPAKPADKENEEFYQVNRDLESIGEFIQRFLSKNHGWARPVFIAGESYGGFRVGKLARKLQETYGVGLNGAILISPALETALLDGSDYDNLMWSDLFPSLVASAVHHGRSRKFAARADIKTFLPQVEAFATGDLIRLLTLGDVLPEAEQKRILTETADYLGLDHEWVSIRAGRISHVQFTRELLRHERKVIGLYDGSITAIDPFPDRSNFEGGDPTLFAIDRVFTSGINSQLRDALKVDTERDYHLLSLKVNMAWKDENKKHVFQTQLGATDDLRYAMSLNPHMKVFITHGYYDLVTPYFASNRLVGLMKLTPEQRQNLTVHHFKGGHMFYAWENSRQEFTDAITKFYQSASS